MRHALVKFMTIGYLLACVTSVAVADQPVSPVHATLVVPDTKLLPGVPFDMWVDLQNTSDGAVGVGLCPALLVHPQQGAAFEIASRGPIGWVLPRPDADPYLVLRPGDRKTLPFPIQHDLLATFFHDARLSPPGKYVISIRLDFCWGHAVPQPSLLPATFLGPALTNEVTIERVQPSGNDAAVWQRMLETSDGHWAPSTAWKVPAQQQVWTDVLSKYPDSGYVPYALIATDFGSSTPERLKQVLAAISRFPNSPAVELLHVAAWQRAATTQPVYAQELATVQQSKRPTTRVLAFPNDTAQSQPCPPEYDCEP